MSLVENIRHQNVSPVKSALMYYKTEPFTSGIQNYHHTNNWEIIRACEIISSKGFSIDLLDRENRSWIPKKKYDLFLGLGVGNSGDQFVKYSKLSGAEKRVLIAMGPQPDISNEKVLKRYEMFNQRTGRNAPPSRTVQKIIGPLFDEIIKNTDYILTIGEKGSESYKSLLGYERPILNFYPAISPKVKFFDSWIDSRSTKRFLCFAGNGLICKGVDILVEAFLKQEDLFLDICGPLESSFRDQYMELINSSKNIRYHGFIEPGEKKFNELASSCAYVIFHSSAEACCTSVATSIKAGLVPVVNPWTGILIDEEVNGFLMSDEGDLIENVSKTIERVSKISRQEYQKILKNSLDHAELFSQDSFSSSYNKCIEEILK